MVHWADEMKRAQDSIGPRKSAGVDFIDENGGGPGVRLRKRHPKR